MDISERVAKACARAGREESSVQIVAVSKTFSPEDVVEASDANRYPVILGKRAVETFTEQFLPPILAVRAGRISGVLAADRRFRVHLVVFRINAGR